jgi:hypothetical protein
MATITRPQQKHYDVLAEALTADGRVVKRVEAVADDLADVAVAFKLAGAAARQCHLSPARLRLTASRAGTTEIAVTEDFSGDADPMAQSALLDGKTKEDLRQREELLTKATEGWVNTIAQVLAWADAAAPDLAPFRYATRGAEYHPYLVAADGRRVAALRLFAAYGNRWIATCIAEILAQARP